MKTANPEYLAYFHSLITSHVKIIFLDEDSVIRIFQQANYWTSDRDVFKKLGIVTLSSKFNYPLMVFLINNCNK